LRELSATTWQRRGSSIVWDRDALGPLLSADCLVSLRKALSWRGGWPVEPPGSGSTVLVGGLETCLEILAPEEAERFLRGTIKPFIVEFQAHWDQRGLVFGFGTSAHSFQLQGSTEELLFVRRDRRAVRLSFAMWDGSSTLNLTRLLREDTQFRNGVAIGYYVQRIS
jgi:hypothetical protein